MAAHTLAERIVRLERYTATLRAQLETTAAGSLTALAQTIDLLEYVTASLVVLRRRRAGLKVSAAAISKQAPLLRARIAPVPPIRGRASVWIRPPATTPVPAGVFALPLPAPCGRILRDGDVELVTIWTPHRDAPSLIGAQTRRRA